MKCEITKTLTCDKEYPESVMIRSANIKAVVLISVLSMVESHTIIINNNSFHCSPYIFVDAHKLLSV